MCIIALPPATLPPSSVHSFPAPAWLYPKKKPINRADRTAVQSQKRRGRKKADEGEDDQK